ncbi:MAG: hypothetical protein C3F12_04580 [Candidatus Methylomirabilota bacterium]|nr:MAG: hypothetical protein C3F12_04580 [candidate division NC10 bacterium]
MAPVRYVAVVGSRSWGRERLVSGIVRWLLTRGFGVITGGALGADTHALAAVLLAGAVDRARLILPWPVDLMPRAVRGLLRRFAALGGRVDTVLSGRPGYNSAAAALRVRTELVVDASCGVLAFLHGATPGTWLTIRYAIRLGRPVVVVTSSGRAPRALPGGRWVAVTDGPLAGAFRWRPRATHPTATAQDPTPLREIVAVPPAVGMPVHDTLTHITALPLGDRLWFERCEVVGDKILAPHPNESDGRPAFLSVPALRKRFGCDVATAVELGELFVALDADETVIGHYAGEAVRWGVDAVTRELFRLVVGLAALEQADDPMDEAEPYVEEPDEEEVPTMPSLAYHVVGSLGPELEEPDWIARQSQPFQELLTRIESCPSLPELAELGKQLYAMSLTHEQAGVAWTWYRLRKEHLQRTLRLSPPAHQLMQQLQRVSHRGVSRFGAYLYRRQHNGLASLPSHEWAAIWQAYSTRKAALAS